MFCLLSNLDRQPAYTVHSDNFIGKKHIVWNVKKSTQCTAGNGTQLHVAHGHILSFFLLLLFNHTDR